MGTIQHSLGAAVGEKGNVTGRPLSFEYQHSVLILLFKPVFGGSLNKTLIRAPSEQPAADESEEVPRARSTISILLNKRHRPAEL